VDIALRDAIATGKVPGPRIIASARAIGITGGHCDRNGCVPTSSPTARRSGPNVADGPDAIRAAVRQSIKDGRRRGEALRHRRRYCRASTRSARSR